jgi:hypothetical protein
VFLDRGADGLVQPADVRANSFSEYNLPFLGTPDTRIFPPPVPERWARLTQFQQANGVWLLYLQDPLKAPSIVLRQPSVEFLSPPPGGDHQ